jgi:hypothetical protein
MHYSLVEFLGKRVVKAAVALALLAAAADGLLVRAGEARTVLSLDGTWEIAEGTMDRVPAEFDRTVPVPGLVDMAKPAFAGVGETNTLREAFWYRRTFTLPGDVPEIATLKVQKAAYGSRVFLNGVLVGDHPGSFTPAIYDVTRRLRGNGRTNEVLVRVGASRAAVPANVPSGWDFEKVRYIPGIFDSVELTLSATPHVVRVQVAPDLEAGSILVQTVLRNGRTAQTAPVKFIVREARSGRSVTNFDSPPLQLGAGEEKTIETRVPVRNARLWTPEHPFLYELTVDTGADTFTTRFGMRTFSFDPATGRARLNGKPFFLRGSNVTLYRFFEDGERKDRPWREEWVRRLHRKFKEMHWNSLRYCIGFPPEMWYRIADEEGFLIQDEFPLWHLSNSKDAPPAAELAKEYTEWMQERWNHPCVVLWDAQNETRTEETGKAIQMVRGLYLSNRPWDNGWSPTQAAGDSFESHPYLFQNPKFKLAGIEKVSGTPGGNVIPNTGHNAIILNEYGWLWLNRDGSPTTLTREVYRNLLGENSTVAQRREFYARTLAALTEFWRGHRACAGVLHFCGLGYSRPDGQTSDHFIDLETLTFEPNFERYVKDAFAPVGVMLDFWADRLAPLEARKVTVSVINDLDRDWIGRVRFRVLEDGTPVQTGSAFAGVKALGRREVSFIMAAPKKPGHYQLEATLMRHGFPTVRSLRDFEVTDAAGR